MRIAQNRLYSHAEFNSNSVTEKLDKVSQQISSGQKISDGFDDSITFTKTLGLDRDISTFKQLKESATNAKSIAEYTDSALDSTTKELEQFKTKILAYANSVHSRTSKEALIGELKGIKSNLLNLANTQVEGKYIFGGTATNRPPIGIGDRYSGNEQDLSITTDRHQIQNYSINGQDLFVGYDKDINHRISTNMPKLNQTALKETPPRETHIIGTDSIKDLTGVEKKDVTFYMSGTKPDGESFKNKFTVTDTSSVTVNDLAEEIKAIYDNEVDVEINKNGEFIITDLKNGNHKMNFHMVGSTADVNDIRDLQDKEVFEFIKSDFKSSNQFNEESPVIASDSVYFEKNGNRLINNVPQFIESKMEYANSTTKLEDVSDGSLLGKTITLEGKDIQGNSFNSNITFNADSTQVNINGASYTLEQGHDEVTYQQLLDVITLSVSGQNNLNNLNQAKELVDVTLQHNGKFEIKDLTSGTSEMELAMYDSNTFSYEMGAKNSISFNQNNAISFDEPSVDIFDTINKAIESVERELYHPDGNAKGFSRNRGVQGALDNLTHSIDHVVKEHTRSGAQLQSINATIERNEVLTLNAEITRNDVINVDMAESSMYFQALTLNYQAILSTVSRVNSLSLVNYLR